MSKLIQIQFPKYEELNGVLSVYEFAKDIPFDVHRVFTVSAKSGNFRGDHAHKKCSQLLVCVAGKIHVTCNDGHVISEHFLDGMGSGLLVGPGIWSTQTYLGNGSLLMVFCDRIYEKEDYIRDYSEFKEYIKLGSK